MKTKFSKRLVAIIVAIVVLIVLGMNSFVVVPSGNTGVKARFGQISDDILTSGIHFKIPFVDKITKISNKQKDITYTGQIWSETSSRTAVYYENVVVSFQILSDKSAWIVANVADYSNNLIPATLVASAVKTASKELSDTDATNRGKIEPLAMENLQTALDEKYGESVVLINRVTISNADFDESYNTAIAEKQTAQLAYEKQQIENQTAIEKAEADAEAKKIAAQAEAEATKISAAAEAEANKELSESITQELIDMKLAEARVAHGWVTVQGANNVITDAE